MTRIRQGSWAHFRPWHRNLAFLCIRDDGGIGLRTHVKKLRTEVEIDHKAFVLFENEVPLGWALVVWHNRRNEFDLQLYVNRSHRRRGFGNRLFRRATKWVKDQGEKYVFFPDPDNNEFFNQAEMSAQHGRREVLQ